MDWYPLLNSLRIAAISAVVVFFTGIAAAYYIAKLPRFIKGILDVILTLPLVLPPTVVGYLMLRVLGFGNFRGSHGNDLVVCHFCYRGCGVPPHVPYRSWCLRIL